jgi:hypothetical protein
MKKMASFLVKKYAQMSGEKKIRIGFDLSKTVRLVREAGSMATGGGNLWSPIRQNFSK